MVPDASCDADLHAGLVHSAERDDTRGIGFFVPAADIATEAR